MRKLIALFGLVVVALAACDPTPPGGVGTPAPRGRTAARGAAGAVVQVPAHIDASGRTDVTDALNDVLARLEPGSTVRFPAGARYRVEGTVVVPQGERVTLDGNGATLFATTAGTPAPNSHLPRSFHHRWPRKRVHLLIDGGSDVTVRDLQIAGANPKAGPAEEAYVPAYEAQHGIEVREVRGALLEGVHIHDTYGDLVIVSDGSDSVTIRRSLLERSGRQGVTVNRGTNVLVEGNIIRDIRRSAIDLEPAGRSWEVRHVTVRNNLFGKIRLLFVASLGAGPVNDVLVEGNHLFGQPMNVYVKAPEGQRRHGFTFVGNVSDKAFNSPIALMRFKGTDGVVVRDNVQPITTRGSRLGIQIEGSCRFDVRGNEFPGATHELVAERPRC